MNPLPLTVGGGPTAQEKAYRQILHAVGVGGAAKDQNGIDGLWRQSKAHGLAAASSHEERAALQADPRFATDLIPYYERVLMKVPPYGATEESRRRAIAADWFADAVSSLPELITELQKIDSRFEYVEQDPKHAIETQLGRAFESTVPTLQSPAFNYENGKGYTDFPEYSTHQVLRVRLNLGYSVPTNVDIALIESAKRILRKGLPSDTDFRITIGTLKTNETPIGLGELI